MLLLIVGGLSVLFCRTDLFKFFVSRQSMASFLDSLGSWGFLGFISLQALQVVVAPIPGEVTGLLGGYLYGPLVGIVLSTVGLTVGSFTAFALSRALGRPFAEKFVPRPAINRFDYLLKHRGLFLVFLLFLIPGIPKDYLCYILGLGQITTTEFLFVGTIGRFFGTILLSLGGNFLRLEQYSRFSILVAAALLAILAAMLCKDKLERLFALLHAKAMHAKAIQAKAMQAKAPQVHGANK
ncbi:TVP38/TMEM64 family protein [Syntrophobacter fumaroxidans]|uniref:TVP38/TMEM64 family membrane protein n=1 Tax=Syntrophobacter fumaroxidans (strain DSM 10017 / MPOB) TaxID=335543 RepID=A0LKX6_SYNFM|nr:VTT domain-containing protein [Syntrophobacter fumaroxidans]ABK18078.1 conserved hypothetical protein [Syntrophobacter fumaroxidans MPOB]